MRFLDGCFALICVLIASRLLWSEDLLPALPAAVLLGLVVVDRLFAQGWPRWLLPILMALAVGGGLWWMGLRAEAPVAPVLAVCALGLSIVAHWLLGQRHGAVAATVVALGAATALFTATEPGGTGMLVAARTLAWYALLIPILTLITPARTLLLPALAVSMLPVLLAGWFLVGERVSPGTIEAIAMAIPMALPNDLVVAQVLLVAVFAVPLSVEADFKWQFLTWCGGGVAASAVALGLVGGPWADGLPTVLWGSLMLAGGACAVGVAGIMGTVRRPGSLLALALRCLALAGLAGLMAALGLLERPPIPSALVATVAAAVAPAAVGLVLVAVVGLATLLGRRLPAKRLRTERVRKDWGRLRSGVSSSVADFGIDLAVNLGHDAKRFSDPGLLVPVLIFAAAWPALFALGPEQAVVLMVVPAILAAGLLERHLLAWTGIHLGLVMGASFAIGVPLAAIPAFGALGLLAAWPFCRWPQFDGAWAYPTAVVAMSPLWMLMAGVEQVAVVLVAGLTVLLANGLRRGAARWVLLAVTAGYLLYWLGSWVPDLDPYATVLLEDQSRWVEAGHILARLPVMLVLVVALWLSRVQGPGWWRWSGWPGRYAICLTVLCAAAWITGVRPGLWGGLVVGLALLMAAPLLHRELGLMPRGWRHPLTTVVALGLVVVLCAIARSLDLVSEVLRPEGRVLRVERAGSLGPVYLDAIRDLGSAFLALPLALGWRVWASQGRVVIAATTRFARRQSGWLKRWLPWPRRTDSVTTGTSGR